MAESFKSWATRGMREERENNPKAALISYSNALSVWKKSDGATGKATILCARGQLREKTGDKPGALNDLTDCLKIDKKNTKGFHRRGVILLNAGKTSEAIRDFYLAVALNIGFAQAYADRARAYESIGEAGFAREDYRHACELGIKAACTQVRALPAKHGPTLSAIVHKESEVSSSSRSQYNDCLKSLNRCAEGGAAFGTCVRKAPNCRVESVTGCCPSRCLWAYQKALDRNRSEAAAFREYFTPGATCATPRKKSSPK